MTTPLAHAGRDRSGRQGRRGVRAVTVVAGILAYGVLMLPIAVTALPLCLLGRTGTLRSLWSALRTRLLRRPVPPSGHGGVPAAAAHTVLSVLVGAVCWVLLGVLTLVVLRGAFYGLVTTGPYDHSWGGPSPSGTWLAHFAISAPFGAAAVGLLYLVSRMHLRLDGLLRGERTPLWVVLVCLLLSALGAIFVVAWAHQI